MNALQEGELSYEARCVHHIAKLGHSVDYWIDTPLTYGARFKDYRLNKPLGQSPPPALAPGDAMEPVLKQPPTLRTFMFHEGKAALAQTPRQFAPEDVREMLEEHQTHARIQTVSEHDGVQEGVSVEVPPYDLIYSTATTGIDMGIYAKRLLGIPLVVQWLDVPYWRIDPYGPWELYKESAMPLPLLSTSMFENYRNEWGYWFSNIVKIDAITCLISVTKEQILEYARRFQVIKGPEVGLTEKKIHVVYHGSVDCDTFDYYLKQPVERKNQVICINRIDFHKGVDQTVAVCAIMQEMMKEIPVRFVFVSRGNDQGYEQQVMEAAKKTLKNVVFTGWVDNATKVRLIRESKVMLDNEWPEGFGGCNIGEAIVCGTVPIAWDRRSKREVYPTEGGLVTVPHGDLNKMAIAACEVLYNFRDNPDPYPYKVSEEAKKFVREYRSVESHAKSLCEVFAKVAGRG